MPEIVLPSPRHTCDRPGRALVRSSAALACLLLAACQAPATSQLRVVQPPANAAAATQQETGTVGLTLTIPRKSSKALRSVLATGDPSSALLVNRVKVSLSGPGIAAPLYPSGFNADHSIDVQSSTVFSEIVNVPTLHNCFLRVTGLSGSQKLNQVGGVLDVQRGPYNHVLVGLATTPTAQVIEKLAARVPDSLASFSVKALQYFLDSQITRPVTGDPTRQNVFLGIHPYRVNADGLANYLASNNLQVPTSFDATRPTDQTFVLQSGRVIVLTDPLPVGSRIWSNDPTSAILQIDGTSTTNTSFTLADVAPNFEPDPGDPTAPGWSLTVFTPAGQLFKQDFKIPRVTLADTPLADVTIDLRGKLGLPAAQVQSIQLSDGGPDRTGLTSSIAGRVARQLFAYAVDATGAKVPLVPDSLSWSSADTRVSVGNGTLLDPTKLSGNLVAIAPDLPNLNLQDYGLVYPLGETSATNPADVANVQATLRGGTLSSTLSFRIGSLSTNPSSATLNVTASGLDLLPASQTLADPTQSATLSLVENAAPPGTTYHWASDNPAVSFDAQGGTSTHASVTGDLGGQPATITVFSSTGRIATASLATAFGASGAQGSLSVGSYRGTIAPLAQNNAGNPSVSSNGGYALGGYLNHYMGQATLSASDPDNAAASFIWRSSDPLTLAVSAAGFASSASVTALRPGQVTVSATDANGHTASQVLVAKFDQFGAASASFAAPVNPINLVGTSPTAIATDLNALYASKTYQASETGVTTPAFRWISLDASRLLITPPTGQLFPYAQATFTALRPGPVSFQLISGASGQVQTFALNLAFANGTGSGQATTPSLLLSQVAPTPVPTGSTSTTIVNRNLGQAVTLQASDPADATPDFVWQTDTPERTPFVSQSGPQAQVRPIAFGAGVIRVVNTRNGHWGVITLDIQSTGKGSGAIQVTL